jgi:hypothetical protein
VRFGSGVIREVYPQWWGAKVDGITDDQPAMQAALDSLPALPRLDGWGSDNIRPTYGYGGQVKLTNGNWGVASPILIDGYQELVGSNQRNTIIQMLTSGQPAIIAGKDATLISDTWCYAIRIADLTIVGISGGTSIVAGEYGIYCKRVARSSIDRVHIYCTRDTGIYVNGSSYLWITNSYIQSCNGDGVFLDFHSNVYYVSATYIESNVIRNNRGVGIRGYYINTTDLVGNVLEANGEEVGEKIGPTGEQTADNYAMNIYLIVPYCCTIERNYGEFGNPLFGDYDHWVQIVQAGGVNNRLIRNNLINGTGMLLYNTSITRYSNTYLNYYENNSFPATNKSLKTYHSSSGAQVNGNFFRNNVGIRWYDQDANYSLNQMTSQEGLPATQTYTHTSGDYTPDFGVTNEESEAATGLRKARVIKITLNGDIAMQVPTNLANDEIITFIFIQGVTGGGGKNVTWVGSYHVTWSDTGNTTGKSSSISFDYANPKMTHLWCL